MTRPSKSRWPSILGALLCAVAASGADSRLLPLHQKKPPQEILAAAAANGAKAAAALRGYTYNTELTLQTISAADVITGSYFHLSKIGYSQDGSRQERVVEEKSTLPRDFFLSSNAVNSLIRVYEFNLTPETLAQYEINYIGRERLDEIDTYAFDVRPAVKLPDPDKSRDRYVKGRIWIDEQDLQVVKVEGEPVPEQSSHRGTKFETYFQNHGKYWFPAYATADDDLRVGHTVTRVIVRVRFTGYEAKSR